MSTGECTVWWRLLIARFYFHVLICCPTICIKAPYCYHVIYSAFVSLHTPGGVVVVWLYCCMFWGNHPNIIDCQYCWRMFSPTTMSILLSSEMLFMCSMPIHYVMFHIWFVNNYYYYYIKHVANDELFTFALCTFCYIFLSSLFLSNFLWNFVSSCREKIAWWKRLHIHIFVVLPAFHSV